jgi:site-specific DNA recombinase
MMDVVIYTRVSTEDQKENGFSLQDQERRLRQHCEQYGKNILEHFQDDHSAKDFRRPAFQQMLDLIKSRKLRPKQLICVRMDRFSRKAHETLNMIQTLKKEGVELYLIEGNINLDIPENLLAFLFQIGLPEAENLRRGENTKAGMRQALRHGKWPWKAPKGYTNDIVTKTVVQNNDAKFIRKAFREVAKGLSSIDAVRKDLNKEGFKCSKQQFINLLRNKFYIGWLWLKAWKIEPEEFVKGLHEPIVDEDIFEQVQEILRGKSRKSSKPSKYNSLFPLRGHLICKDCGANLTASSSTGRSKRYHYYHCQHGCKERIEAEVVNNTFNSYLKSFQVSNEVAELYIEIIKDVFKEEEGSKEDKAKSLRAKINALQADLTRADNNFLSGTLGDANYKRISERLMSDIDRVEDEIKQLGRAETNLERHFTYGVNMLTNLTFYFNNAPIEIKHKIVGSIFPEKLIFENESYRTTKVNSLVSLMCSKSTSKDVVKTKQAIIADGLSTWALPPGLEPGTL